MESKYDNEGGNKRGESGGSSGYMTCPMCDAELPITDEDAKAGLYCSACSTPLKVVVDAKKQSYLDEDF